MHIGKIAPRSFSYVNRSSDGGYKDLPCFRLHVSGAENKAAAWYLA
jgi:hypothetical protein